jgi:hypothetical protein
VYEQRPWWLVPGGRHEREKDPPAQAGRAGATDSERVAGALGQGLARGSRRHFDYHRAETETPEAIANGRRARARRWMSLARSISASRFHGFHHENAY